MTHAPLAPCPSCQRHVRSDVTRCPFCAADVAIAPASIVPASTTTLSRAAVFTFATTLALGCASTQEPAPQTTPPVATAEPAPVAVTEPVTPIQAPADPGAVAPMYGAPVAVDAGPAPAMDAAVDAPADAPAVDAGRPARPTRPSGSIQVRYGSPPRPED